MTEKQIANLKRIVESRGMCAEYTYDADGKLHGIRTFFGGCDNCLLKHPNKDKHCTSKNISMTEQDPEKYRKALELLLNEVEKGEIVEILL
jgi:hypothetical protein